MTNPIDPPSKSKPAKIPPCEARRDAAIKWWSELQPFLRNEPNPKADRGALSRLRRASTALDALSEETVLVLHRKLGFKRAGKTLVRVAVLASVLAHVREHDSLLHPAWAVGNGSLSDSANRKMSPLRLQRLLQAREPDDVLRQMRRLVALARHKLDVGALADAILNWFDETGGDRARARFAYYYYDDNASDPSDLSAADPLFSDA